MVIVHQKQPERGLVLSGLFVVIDGLGSLDATFHDDPCRVQQFSKTDDDSEEIFHGAPLVRMADDRPPVTVERQRFHARKKPSSLQGNDDGMRSFSARTARQILAMTRASFGT